MVQVSFQRYATTSIFAAAAVLGHAFATRRQYFAAMYYLATSKLSIFILGNFAFVLAMLVYKVVTAIYLGRLRESEIERINERIHHGTMEICLTLTVFRQEFDAPFIVLMVLLAFMKVFHWLVQDRVNYMQTEQSISRLQHVRVVSFLGLLLALDALAIRESMSAAIRGEAGYQILFTFEYAILATMAVTSLFKYAFACIDTFYEHHWQAKGLMTLYLELFMDIIHFIFYITFFLVTMHRYATVPIHLVRDVYVAYASLVRRVGNYLRYRDVSSKIHHLPAATADDVTRVGGVCIICREEMAANDGLKLLRCNHVFHLACLRSWLERQQTCPICRHTILLQTGTGSARRDAAPAAAAQAEGAAAPAAGGGDAAAPPGGAAIPAQPPANGATAPPTQGDAAGGGSGAPTSAVPGASGQAGAPRAPTAAPGAGAGTAAGGSASSAGTHAGASGGLPTAQVDRERRRAERGAGATLPPLSSIAPEASSSAPASVHAFPIAAGGMGLPPNATREERVAFAAAQSAFAAMTPYLAPMYSPFGLPMIAASPSLADVLHSQAAPAAAATSGGGAVAAASSQEDASSSGTPATGARRAREDAASAAVQASVAATRMLLHGHIAVLQQQLTGLDTAVNAMGFSPTEQAASAAAAASATAATPAEAPASAAAVPTQSQDGVGVVGQGGDGAGEDGAPAGLRRRMPDSRPLGADLQEPEMYNDTDR